MWFCSWLWLATAIYFLYRKFAVEHWRPRHLWDFVFLATMPPLAALPFVVTRFIRKLVIRPSPDGASGARKVKLSTGKQLLIGYGAAACLIVLVSVVSKACTLNTAAYAAADHFVRADAEVSAKLGAVKETSMKWYHFSTGSRGTYAKFAIAVSGAKDHGIANLQLEKQENVWRVTTASLALSSGKVVALR
jgi:hypothetical protein